LLPASRWFLAWCILRLWRWRRHVPPKRQLTNEDPLWSVKREVLDQLNVKCTELSMHKECGYKEIIEVCISVSVSCLAKERCIPVTDHFKLMDICSENNDFGQSL
jgi:hypothetical protein